jgi:hypothetical protein
MTTYTAKITLPAMVQTMVQEVQAVGAVVGITDQHLLVEFDVDDDAELALYELGRTSAELQQTLLTVTCDPAISVSMPVRKT